MKRWPLEDLADYVRGVADPRQQAAIEADLAVVEAGEAADPASAEEARAGYGGTADPGAAEPLATRADLGLLREIVAALRADARDRAPGPSEDTLLGVSAMFTAAAADPDPALAPLELLTVHDPQAGLYSGFRSAQLGHKDLEIHGQRFDLELSIDTPYDAIDVVVVGRLTAGETERWSVDRVPAILVARGDVLATAVTNRFGEFHVAAQSEEDDVELCLLIQGVGQIRVPIDRKDPYLSPRL
jgi:hypothetical protein